MEMHNRGEITDEEMIIRIRELHATSDDPYLQPNGTLRNKLGITDQAPLSLAETDLVAARAKLLELNLPRPPFSFDRSELTTELFQDVYPWGGGPARRKSASANTTTPRAACRCLPRLTRSRHAPTRSFGY